MHKAHPSTIGCSEEDRYFQSIFVNGLCQPKRLRRTVETVTSGLPDSTLLFRHKNLAMRVIVLCPLGGALEKYIRTIVATINIKMTMESSFGKETKAMK